MKHLCYDGMARPSRDETPVFNRLERVRTDRGLTRQALADLVGVHYQTIGYLERGEYSPSLSLALRLATALEIAVGDVFSLHPWVEEPVPAPVREPVR